MQKSIVLIYNDTVDAHTVTLFKDTKEGRAYLLTAAIHHTGEFNDVAYCEIMDIDGQVWGLSIWLEHCSKQDILKALYQIPRMREWSDQFNSFSYDMYHWCKEHHAIYDGHRVCLSTGEWEKEVLLYAR